ncbi:CG6985 [Drosophila busckii]|uniref:CG6985 n=1 Tax=Drosophila busckii TaxID=30019 RepID=A0A0M4F3X4_DROBS|nr:CG6985 [Drosophila busckii]
MRRYATKRSSEDDYYESESYTYTSSAAAEDSWGTTEGYKSLGPQQYAAGENPLSNKRIFLVLWRVKSSRKHKNWTGNGTLELTSTEATLKDETGKDLGVLTHFEGDEFYQNALLDIGIRDVEIQNELTTIEECIAQRKAEYDFWYRQHTNVIEVAPAMVSKPYIPAALRRRKKLKKPLADVDTNTSAVYTHPIQQFVVSEHDTATSQPIQQFIANEHDSATSQPIQQFEASEYICLLKPAQLQMETLQLLSDYYQDLETVSC